MHVQEMYRRLTGLVVFRQLLHRFDIQCSKKVRDALRPGAGGQRRFLRRLRRI